MNKIANLELNDIQSGAVRPRPTPYAATYLLLRIDDRRVGREFLRRASEAVASAADPASPVADTWISVGLTYQGLKALGVPEASLHSFAPEFKLGMAARSSFVGGHRGERAGKLGKAPGNLGCSRGAHRDLAECGTTGVSVRTGQGHTPGLDRGGSDLAPGLLRAA